MIRTLQTQTLSILIGKNLLSLQGTPVLITESLFSLQGFPCKPLYFLVRDCSERNLSLFLNYFYFNTPVTKTVIVTRSNCDSIIEFFLQILTS